MERLASNCMNLHFEKDLKPMGRSASSGRDSQAAQTHFEALIMKNTSLMLAAAAAIVSIGETGADEGQPLLTIERGVELSWPTAVGNTYQPQGSANPDGPWFALGGPLPGDGMSGALYDPAAPGSRGYQVIELVPGSDPSPSNPVNGGFELGEGTSAQHWTTEAGQPPARSSDEARSGSFSMRSALINSGSASSEGIFFQNVVAAGGAVVPGQSYDFTFWAKQISAGDSYVQQYQVEWRNGSNGVVGGTGLTNFNGVIGSWAQIAVPNLVAPATAVEARVRFRFVTGAISGVEGEVFIDDVALDSGGGSGPALPPVENVLEAAVKPVAKLSWPSDSGVTYHPVSTVDFEAWTPIPPAIEGDGGQKEVFVEMNESAAFFRLEMPVAVVLPPSNLRTFIAGPANSIGLAWDASPTPGVTGYRIRYGIAPDDLNEIVEIGPLASTTITGLTPGQTYHFSVVAITATGESAVGEAILSAQPSETSGILALFNAGTTPEPATTIDTPEALITRVGDRARDRHAREGMFHAYDHYLTWYWEERTIGIEIIDRVAKGGSTITFNYQTLTALSQPEFRAFYRGIGTVAEYHFNHLAPLIGPNLYTATLTSNLQEGRPLQMGDRVEIEVSQFIQAPMNGRNNYYGTAILYIVGEGIVPWKAAGALQDSFPLPEIAWLGGRTTLPYQYSNEPEHRFKQTSGNIAPENIQPFMLGRRLHHTDFGNGTHSEPGNPVFDAHVGKLGSKFIARSCVECHVNNGRALPPAIGAPMLQTVVKTGSDAAGSPHPLLGEVLQPQSTAGAPESVATIVNYITTAGEYGDGTPYSLRKPVYAFQGTTPSHFSVRLAPPLVGLGLLEAIAESTIEGLADPDDANQDGISGRVQTVVDPETGELRLGRFTGKAGQARISHQIAAALNTDMGVTTSVFPVLDGESIAGTPEVSVAELDQMTRYVALLGVGARRDLTDDQALRGEQLFTTAQCVKCHTPELETSPYHPMAELRNQTIRPFTDLLLHDMGEGLADNMGENGATGAEWRTPPLWGIGLTAGVSDGEAYLHDGRARTLEEAILWHGGEAEASKEAFRTMPAADRDAIIKFLKSL